MTGVERRMDPGCQPEVYRKNPNATGNWFQLPYCAGSIETSEGRSYAMSFEENLQSLRDRSGLTQEALAERLGVSRQSVSKWESGGSFPEMEKLFILCELFHVDLDTMLRGNVVTALSEDHTGYDRHMNWFGQMLAGATFLILMGVSAMLILISVGVSEALAATLLMVLVAVAVVLYMVAGMTHERFEKRFPLLQDFYTEEQKERNHQKTVVLISGGVAAIIVAVACLVLFGAQVEGNEAMELRLVGAFLLIVGFAVAFLIYGGVQSDKCNLERWNAEHDQSPEKKALRHKVGAVCGSIMLGAVAIYLAVGFGMMALDLNYGTTVGWQFGWIVFPVAGVLCAIASNIIKRNDPDESV